jgi:hypothetical protein
MTTPSAKQGGRQLDRRRGSGGARKKSRRPPVALCAGDNMPMRCYAFLNFATVFLKKINSFYF